MADNNFKCSGNCLNCLPAQRAYCASQHAYSNMKVLDQVMAEIINIRKGMEMLEERISTLRDGEESVFNPEDIAQNGDGAARIETPN